MRVSVEYAHTNLAAPDQEDVERSCMLARLVTGHLEQLGHEVQRAVLLDDKKAEPQQATLLAEWLLSTLQDTGDRPELVFYETELKAHLPALQRLLPAKPLRKLNRDTSHYAKFGNLPCSVDIALWHALRLGVLTDPRIRPVDVAISVLDAGNREHEDLAQSNLLDHLADAGAAPTRVLRLYYPETSAAPFDSSDTLHELDQFLKEVGTCPAF